MSELPRLLLCSFDVLPGPTGSSRRLTEYLRGLSDHFNVVVLSTKTPDHSHIERFEGARLLRVPIGTGDFASKLQTFDRAVRRQLESEEYEVVHFTDPFGGYALAELRESYGYKLVYEAQTFPSQELRFTHPQLEGDRRFLARVRRQELFCLMNSDKVITGSEVTRAFIRGLGVSPEAIELMPTPVELEPYANIGPPNGRPMRAIYLGSQVGWQGLPTLLRALEFANRTVDVRLSVVGPSHTAWQPLLEDLVCELNLEEKVRFLGAVPHAELPKVLAEADVGMLPIDDLERNRVQGGPLSKAAEYLAAGRPVVASDLPVAREHLPEHATYFHAPGDADDLGDCLIDLANDPALRVKMSAAARAYAQRYHDSARVRQRLLRLYLEVAGLAAPEVRDREDVGPGQAPTMIGTPPGALAMAPLAAPAVPPERSTDPEISPEKLRPNARRRARRLPREEADSKVGTDPAVVVPSADMASPPPLPRSATVEPLPEEVHPDEVVAVEDEAAELADHEVLEADAIEEADHPHEAAPEFETADDAVLEADAELEPPFDPLRSPAPLVSEPEAEAVSRLDAWFAQLVHGYCPPEGAQFARPTPPTNFPGRDGPPPPTVQPAAPVPQSFPSRSDDR